MDSLNKVNVEMHECPQGFGVEVRTGHTRDVLSALRLQNELAHFFMARGTTPQPTSAVVQDKPAHIEREERETLRLKVAKLTRELELTRKELGRASADVMELRESNRGLASRVAEVQMKPTTEAVVDGKCRVCLRPALPTLDEKPWGQGGPPR